MTAKAANESGHVRVTGDAVDPPFSDPYTDVDEWREMPVPHRYVHGGFLGTQARFSFYFPPPERYQGRFHHNSYPLAITEDIAPFPVDFEVATGNLGFTLDSGAYYVQTNNGAAFRHPDPTLAAYRVNAAAAKYSRIVAAKIYGPHRPFGYLYGGSGGAYQAIGGAEHTEGVWDGYMPFVLGCNNAVPSLWSVRLNALRILRRRNKLPGVVDAINPGGSGDPYAGLNSEERAALQEATRMGYPLRGWYNHETLHNGYFSDVFGVIPAADPTYAEDFWSKPGYRGSGSDATLAAERFRFETTVTEPPGGRPLMLGLADAQGHDLGCAHLTVLSGRAAGNSLHISVADGKRVGFASTSNPAVIAALAVGDRVRIDNSWLLAAHHYAYHQVPPDAAEYGWDQFRGVDGQPLYPQRNLLIGHFFALNAVGALLSGRISGKMLLVQALMDIDALAWCADWYRSEVRKSLGDGFEENFVLWFIDHAQHDNPKNAVSAAHTVRLDGALQQGLRDLALWVEKGVRPTDTAYKVVDGQIEVPTNARARRGIQPTIELAAGGAVTARVAIGQPVVFAATAEVPQGAGRIVAAEWDFEGTGSYVASGDPVAPAERITVQATYAYSRPGTYFAGLRVTGQREGNAETPYARVQNLARVRVLVE